MTVPEPAEYLDVGRNAVYHLLRDGGKENTPRSCPDAEETTAGNPHPPHPRNGWSRTEAAPPPDTITGAQKSVSESGTSFFYRIQFI